MESGCFNGLGKQHSRTSSGSKHFEGGDKPKHSYKRPSFVKVLGRDFSKQLQIPQDFSVNFNGYIPHRFIIESAITKKCWRVEVEEDADGWMYFREGWGDFVEAHSLEAGNFLVFEYEEQSIFQVKIYGKNGCEKRTAGDAKSADDHKLGKNTVLEDDGEIEVFEHEPEILKENRRKKMRILSLKNCNREIYKKQHARNRDQIRANSINKNHTRTAKVSINENRVCFSFTLHKRLKYQFHQLTLPKAVTITKRLWRREKLELRDAKGRCWPVKLIRRIDGRSVSIGVGWKNFLGANNVGHGDTLNFEFVSDDVAQVHVTKGLKNEHLCEEVNSQNEASGSLNMDCEHDEPAICTTNDKDEASISRKQVSSKCTSSSFSFMWRTNTIGSYLYVPKAVTAAQDLRKKENIVLRGPDGKCWSLEVKKYSDGRVVLGNGWPDFWKGHAITAGDLMSFKFVSEYLVQVDINRGKPLEPAVEEEAVINSGLAIDDEGTAIDQIEAVA